MKKSLLTILCVLLSTISWAQGTTAGDSTAVAEPYAVLSADSLTVTFYYDNQKSARGGMDINNSYIDDGNSSPYGTATMAVFDASFANYLPTSTAYWFQRCNLLTEIRGLSNLNSANVTNMRFMFDNCSSLTNLDMSGFNTTNVTDMVLLFAGCSALTSLDLSGLNTTNVTEMNWMFDGCSSLTSLDVSGFNTANVTNMSGMFHECSSLTSLDLSGFNTANVTNMSWMFERCSALTNIYVSSTWTTSQVTANNGSNMFNECVNLVGGAGTTFSADHTDYTYARIDAEGTPGYLTDSKNASMTHFVMITVEGNGEVSAGQAAVIRDRGDVHVANGEPLEMFFFPDEGYQLTSLMVGSEDVTSQVTPATEYSAASYTIPGVYGDIAITVTFAQTSTDAEAYAALSENNTVLTFYYDSQKTARGGMSVGPFSTGEDRGWDSNVATITKVVFDESFAEYHPTSTSYWFSQMSALTTIEGISNLKTDNVTNMNSMFSGCSSLTSLDVNSFNTANVTDMAYIFYGCSSLTSLDVSGFKTDNLTEMWRMFYGCSSLTTLDLSNFNTAKVYDMRGMFDGCSGLTTIYAGAEWSTAALTVSAPAMFNNCINLVGGAGTTYSTDHIDYTYARIDGGTANPGYFTEGGDKEAAEPYAVLSENNTILTFYYDSQKTARGGLTFLEGTDVNWPSSIATVTNVVIDSTFVNYLPTSTANWFNGFSNLTAISGIEYLNTANVTDMSVMFCGCSRLTSLDVSGFNTANVTKMSGMFYGCSLTSLDLSGFNTANVTNMDNMFDSCWLLTSLDVSGFNTANVTDMSGMFKSCRDLPSLDLSGFNTANVTNMALMFSGCTGLTTIYVGSEWSTEKVTDGTVMFEGCQNLVGGAGTTYDSNYSDHTYAHIDGGTANPGYFTDKNAPITVAAPEFRFEGDNLAMTTETQNAGIFYKVADLPSMDDAVVESVVNSLIVTADGQSTYYDQPFELKKAAVVKAIAIIRNETATFVSDTTTMVYDYEAWVNLKAAVSSGTDLYGRAQGNPNVDTQLLEQLQWALNEGDMIYNNRAQMDSFEATHFTQRINELCAQIEAQMTPTEQVATPNFSWQNDELTISTTTEGADIYYWLSDVDVNGDGVITDADYAHYNNPLTIQRDVTIKAYAAKQAMDNSEIRTLDYPYTSWQTLREVISYASSVADRARHSAKVPDQEVASFEEDIAASYDMYEHRTETKDRVEEVARYLSERAYEIERMMEVEATFVDGVLTIEGNTTVAEALESFGVSTVTESIAAIVYNSSVPMANSDLQAITNPNLLIYVKSDSLAPADRNNIIVDGFAKNIVLTDVAQGNNDFYCPQSFTAEAISYTREFKQKTQIGVSRGWETIALPFNVQTIMHETRGLITPFGNNRSNTHFWLRRLTHDGLQSDSIIEANTAYLISMPNSEEYSAEFNLAGRVTFSAANVTVPVTEIIMDESANYMMAPVFQRLAAQNNLYVLNVGEQRNGYPEGSIFESNYRAVLPFQAYVEHKGSNPAPPYFIVGDMGGDTTGIDATLVNSERVNSEAWYTLDGRKLQGKPTQKGVYITNGKKVIIK